MSAYVRLLLALTFLPALARAAAPPGVLDRAGDPLPRGAVARCGTERFRAQPNSEQVLLSPDGRLLAVETRPPGRDRSIELFDAATGKLLRSIPLRRASDWSSAPSVLAFTPSGDRLACLSSTDSTLRVYDTTTGRELHRLLQAPYAFATLAIDGSGALLAVGLERAARAGPLLELYDLRTGKRLSSLRPLHSTFAGLALSRDGKRLASWGRTRREGANPEAREVNRTVQVWDAATGKEVRQFTLPEPPLAGAFRGDGLELALAGPTSLYLCDPATGSVRKRWSHRAGSRDSTWARPPLSLTYSADGAQLLWVDDLNEMRLVDLATLKMLPCGKVRVHRRVTVTLLAHGSLRACGQDGARLLLWDVRSDKLLSDEEGQRGGVWGFRFSGPGRVWTSSFDDLIEWDLTGRELRRNFLRGKDGKPLTFRGYLPVFSPHGRFLLRPFSSGIAVHEAATGKEIGPPVEGHRDAYHFQFSADESLVALTDRYCEGRTFQVRLIRTTGREAEPVRVESEALMENTSVALSPDGRQLAVLVSLLVRDGEVNSRPALRLYDTATGRHMAEHRFPPRLLVAGASGVHPRRPAHPHGSHRRKAGSHRCANRAGRAHPPATGPRPGQLRPVPARAHGGGPARD